jgi:uncharacterized protein YndB with AHSA1/START domain
MSTPDVPLRMDLTIEVPGTPEQVWDAIATGNGITSWFMPSEVEEREGGAVAFHMGETSSRGHVSAWDPPKRLEYVEPEWAALTGHEDAEVTPLVTEFLVEATSGGTCVVRVVSSAFGVGADWEQEFFDDMEKGWTPFFENLRLVLAHFPGQRVSALSAEASVPGGLSAVFASVREQLGVSAVGQSVELHGAPARVERLSQSPEPTMTLLRLLDPVPGWFGVFVDGSEEGPVRVWVEARVFSSEGPKFVERETPTWREWLAQLSAQFASNETVPS